MLDFILESVSSVFMQS